MNKIKLGIIVLILILPSIVFSQTSVYVTFMIKVDMSAPNYSNFESNTTNISSINQSILFSAYWEDEYQGVDQYAFEWNITGTFQNNTIDTLENGWSNVTKTISNSNYEGNSVYYKFYGTDVNNNMNATYYKWFNIIDESPQFTSLSQSTNNPISGEIVNINSYWTDNFNVYNASLQTNHSGEWSDNQTSIINSESGWGNFSWDTTDYSGETIYWRIRTWDNSTNLNINTTEEDYFIVS